MPTRLIEIEANSQRLRLSSDLTSRSRYVTLSHCWGKLVPLQLFQNNLAALQNDIPTAKLSKTFQHAIEVTRELGLKYLWIDSLCIIQDSSSDWQSEAATMGDVYSDSLLTVVAASAPDGSVGLFFNRNPQTVSIFSVLMGGSGSGSGGGDGDRKEEGEGRRLYGCFPGKLYQDCVTFSLLAKRAWCLQERYLAHRKVFFSDKQLVWQCCESIACETFPNGTEHYERDFYYGVWDEWWRTAQAYSATEITYKTDRLVAFSGIARRLSPVFESEYYAGLWGRDLPRQLLWATFETGGIRDIPYVAPSWSWASAHRMIYYPATGHDYHAPRIRIDSVKVVPQAEENPHGQAASAAFTLTCLPMVRGYRKSSSWDPPVLSKGFWEANEVSYSTKDPVYFLLVLESLSGSEIVGICLERAGLVPGEFQRIGLFRVIGIACEPFKELMADGGEFLADESDYGDTAVWSEAQKCYQITII